MKFPSDSIIPNQIPPYASTLGASSVLQCLHIVAFHLTNSLHDGHSRNLPGTSLIGGNRITIKMGNQKMELKKNHPTALRPLLFASKAPIVPGTPQIIRIMMSSGTPIPNMLYLPFITSAVSGSLDSHLHSPKLQKMNLQNSC